MNITLDLRVEDAEPILRQAAFDAALYGAWCDFITPRTVNGPCGWNQVTARKKEWFEKFLRAKRTVEAFGVEYQMLEQADVLGTYIPHKMLKSHLVNIGGLTMRYIDKSVPDPKNARPRYLGEACRKAAHAAADRVVQAWRGSLKAAA